MIFNDNNIAIPDEYMALRIYLIRGQKVMLDLDLALLWYSNESLKAGSSPEY
jgi:hypothetical protein